MDIKRFGSCELEGEKEETNHPIATEAPGYPLFGYRFYIMALDDLELSIRHAICSVG